MKKISFLLIALLPQMLAAVPATAQYQSQSQSQAYEEEMARLRAEALLSIVNSQQGVSSGESFPTTPQPSLSDAFRGGQGVGTYSGNPYSPSGR
ncbi:exported hypothetical protein [Candidatus Terasakiella magnetica]|nr:exported hypothetical protein [Candidatus Terasakiella magnetica]